MTNEEYVTIEGYENNRVPLRVLKALDEAREAWLEAARQADRLEEQYGVALRDFTSYSGLTLEQAEQKRKFDEQQAAYRAERAPAREKLAGALRNNRFKVG